MSCSDVFTVKICAVDSILSHSIYICCYNAIVSQFYLLSNIRFVLDDQDEIINYCYILRVSCIARPALRCDFKRLIYLFDITALRIRIDVIFIELCIYP